MFSQPTLSLGQIVTGTENLNLLISSNMAKTSAGEYISNKLIFVQIL